MKKEEEEKKINTGINRCWPLVAHGLVGKIYEHRVIIVSAIVEDALNAVKAQKRELSFV